MSVLVKGMKMPKGCFQKEVPHRCPFCNGTKCVLMNEVIPQRVNRRLDGCPIDEVPEHGRLIDAEATLMKAYNIDLECLDVIEKLLKSMPVIVDAEDR